MKDIYPKEKRKQNISCEYPFDVDFHQFDWVLMISETKGVPVPPKRKMYTTFARKKVPFSGIFGWGTYGSDSPGRGKWSKCGFFWKLF